MLAIGKRRDTVEMASRRASPDDDVAVLESMADGAVVDQWDYYQGVHQEQWQLIPS